MSDPVTNVEIEDVLSSIRRLVSDGDKARTRDPAPVEADTQVPAEEAPVEQAAPESAEGPKPEKFVLTPAFMVVDNDRPADAAEETSDDEGEVAFTHQPNEAEEPAEEEGIDDAETDPLPDQPEALILEQPSTDTSDAEHASNPEADEPEETAAPQAETDGPDRASLVATIAELEAAVSGGSNDYEPDGSEVVEEAIEWPGSINSAFDPDTVEDAVEEAKADEATDPMPNSGEAADQDDAAPESTASEAEAEPAEDVYGDDDLDGLLDVGGVAIDEEALKELVSDVVRAELSGPLGEKITRNVRKLVRREIYRILSSQDFD